MARIRPHLTYANVMVTLLSVAVLGGGGAYAAGVVGHAKTADNAKALGGFPAADYTQDYDVASSEKNVKLDAGLNFTHLNSFNFRSHSKQRSSPMFLLPQVRAGNTTSAPAVITLRMTVDGKVDPDAGTISQTVPPGETQNIFGVLKCNGYPSGSHRVGLEAQSTGASLVIESNDELALRPIVIPPGRSHEGGG